MRYPKDQKENTRKQLVEAAAGAIRRDGIAGTGVIGLTAELGLTQGALYRHFPSKDGLVEAASVEAVRQMQARIDMVLSDARTSGVPPIEAFIDWYLSPKHRETRSAGCLIAALGGELDRQPTGLRDVVRSSVSDTAKTLAAEIPGGTIATGVALYALLAGMLQLSRLAVTEPERDQILADGRASARHLINAWSSRD